MTVRSLRRRPLSLPLAALLLAGVSFGPCAVTLSAQERIRAGYGPTLAERRAAARLAQRERDAARRRSTGYTFGDFSGGVSDAALQSPRLMRERADLNDVVTQVRVIVLVDGAAGALGARRWRETFNSLDTATSVRTGRPGDELGVTETAGVGLRTVTATGRLTPGGDLVFADRRFSPRDRRALAEWVTSLSTHGAAGDPSGQPMWGLSDAQFRTAYEALSAGPPKEFAAASGGTLGPALLALELPPTMPVRFTDEANVKLRATGGEERNAPNDGPLPGFSKGTTFAALLARRGLAFHPHRLPSGRLELTVVPRPAGDELTPIPGSAAAAEPGAASPTGAWPVGWKVQDGPGRLAAAAGIYTLTNVGLRESTLNDFAVAAGAASGVPVLLDVAALRGAGVDPAKETVSVPPGRGTWDKAVRYAVAEHALKSELRRDEAGRGFLWITPARR